MTPEEYAALQAVITAAAANYASNVGSLFANAALSLSEWLQLLKMIFPQVEKFRRQSAGLAREFYDSQRAQFHPELPRHDRYTEGYQFDWFVQNMEPSRKKLSQQQASQSAVAEFAFQFVREVENAGRRQIIHAVESDTGVTEKVTGSQPWVLPNETRLVQGWARVATGRETCAWCLMLVSRGPVYGSAKQGGSRYDSDTTIAALRDDAAVTDFMNEWHAGCDCKVVPVFDEMNWPGMQAHQRAEQLWIDASGDAEVWRKRYPGRVHATGKNKGKKITFSEDVVLALRRRVDGGLINSQEWAALTPAA